MKTAKFGMVICVGGILTMTRVGAALIGPNNNISDFTISAQDDPKYADLTSGGLTFNYSGGASSGTLSAQNSSTTIDFLTLGATGSQSTYDISSAKFILNATFSKVGSAWDLNSGGTLTIQGNDTPSNGQNPPGQTGGSTTGNLLKGTLVAGADGTSFGEGGKYFEFLVNIDTVNSADAKLAAEFGNNSPVHLLLTLGKAFNGAFTTSTFGTTASADMAIPESNSFALAGGVLVIWALSIHRSKWAGVSA